MRRRFHEANIVAVPCKRAQQASLKCWDLLGQKFDRFQTVSNKCQQVPTLLWFHVNGCNKSQHCWTQQCWVLLANNVASICMGLYSEAPIPFHPVGTGKSRIPQEFIGGKTLKPIISPNHRQWPPNCVQTHTSDNCGK